MTNEKPCEESTPHGLHLWSEDVPLIPGIPVEQAWHRVDYICRGVGA